MFDFREQLLALADPAEVLPPELEQQFLLELSALLASQPEEVDAFAHLLLHLASQVAFASGEIARLHGRIADFRSGLARAQKYAIHILRHLQREQLQGRVATLTLELQGEQYRLLLDGREVLAAGVPA